MSRSRVVILHYQTYPEIRVAKFAATLADAGMDVTVIARDAVDGSDPRAKHPYGAAMSSSVRTRSVAGADAGRFRRAVSTPYPVSPLWLSEIRTALAGGVDLVICRDFHLSPAATRLAHRQGVPVLLDIAENYPALLRLWRRHEGRRQAVTNSVVRNVALAEYVERAGVRAADAVTVVVPEHEARMRQMGARKVSTIENAPDLHELLGGTIAAPPDDGDDVLRVTYTGEIHRYRGIDTVIAAASLLRDRGGPRVRFELIGTGKLYDDMVALAARTGVTDLVRFHGWQADLRPFMAASDIGLIPPHASEHQDMTMPNKLYDFMAFGKPVVVSDGAPMKRVVTDADAGLVFPAGDAVALADRVARLASSPSGRARMGKNARFAVQTRYNWDTEGAKLIDVVTGLIGGLSRAQAKVGGKEVAP